MKKLLVAIFTLVFAGAIAYAGTATLNYNSSGSSPVRMTTDGSSNNLPNNTIWDATAGANGLAINSSGQASVTLPSGADVVEGTQADAAYTGSGSASVISILKGIYTAITSPIPLGTTGGWTPAFLNSLTNSAQSIKSSAGWLGTLQCTNNNAIFSYVQVYNVASGSVNVGTTTPLYVLGIPASSSNGFVMNTVGMQFGTAISAAATTTATGGTAPSNSLLCSYGYN